MSKSKHIVDEFISLEIDEDGDIFMSVVGGGLIYITKKEAIDLAIFLNEQYGMCDGCGKMDSDEAYQHVMDNPPDPAWMNIYMEKWMIE